MHRLTDRLRLNLFMMQIMCYIRCQDDFYILVYEYGDVWLTSKKNTSTMINAYKYTNFMINADKNADSMFNTKNF